MHDVNVRTDALFVELDTERKIRHRNKLYYRFNHWPVWIWAFFILPGPLTFRLFEHGFDSRALLWLGVVVLGTVLNEKVAASRPYSPITRGRGVGLGTGVSAQEETARTRPRQK